MPLINKQISFVCLFFAVLGLLSPCQAEVYKWTDENGRVHFSDRPIGENVEQIDVKTTAASDSELTRRRDKRQRLLDSYARDRKEKTADKRQAAKAKKQRQENCIKAQKELDSIRKSSFLYVKTDDPDNPRIYSDAERRQATEAAQANVDKWCHSSS